jgi:methyl-accepting chemotaxis protein
VSKKPRALQDNEVFAVYSREPELVPQPDFPLVEGYTISSKRLTWVKPIYQDGDFIGTVHIESDISVLYEQVLRSIFVVLLITIASASLALLLGFKFLHTVSDPINHLIHTANRVSRERDYSLRASQYADDGLGTLTREFNEMLEEIQGRDAEMERRVEERTEELSQTNDKLQASL